MVCDSHGRNYKLGDPIVKREHGYLQERDVEAGRDVRCQQTPVPDPQRRLVSSRTLTVGDEWEGIIYSLGQIIAPFGPELENSF